MNENVLIQLVWGCLPNEEITAFFFAELAFLSLSAISVIGGPYKYTTDHITFYNLIDNYYDMSLFLSTIAYSQG